MTKFVSLRLMRGGKTEEVGKELEIRIFIQYIEAALKRGGVAPLVELSGW